jgi:hypothetical protein
MRVMLAIDHPALQPVNPKSQDVPPRHFFMGDTASVLQHASTELAGVLSSAGTQHASALTIAGTQHASALAGNKHATALTMAGDKHATALTEAATTHAGAVKTAGRDAALALVGGLGLLGGLLAISMYHTARMLRYVAHVQHISLPSPPLTSGLESLSGQWQC